MLREVNGSIQEVPIGTQMALQTNACAGAQLGQVQFYDNNSNNGYYWPYYAQWQSYPVYVTSDRTKKAIEVLKALQAEHLLECKSVPKFIELVEKIAGLL